MTLYRAIFLLAVAVASTSAFAADPNSAVASSDVVSLPSGITASSGQGTTWFTGTRRVNPQLSLDETTKISRNGSPVLPTAGALNEASCLTLRTYKVKRTERLMDNESASRGYTTCQALSNYQIRTAVGTQKLQVPPQ